MGQQPFCIKVTSTSFFFPKVSPKVESVIDSFLSSPFLSQEANLVLFSILLATSVRPKSEARVAARYLPVRQLVCRHQESPPLIGAGSVKETLPWKEETRVAEARRRRNRREPLIYKGAGRR